ncbi:MAG: hypothetical protein LCH39_08340 [Proteobacteria bacterium]|nr:hypothetical protein [Pseudomonadota bacterium]
MSQAAEPELVAAMRALLLRDWDPIGIAREPAAQDEYDTYAEETARLLSAGAEFTSVEAYLRAVVRNDMRMDHDPADYPALMSKMAALRTGD